MTTDTHLFLTRIHQQFIEYYDDFLTIAERAPGLFIAGKVDARLQDDLIRVQLYRLAIDKSVTFAKSTLDHELYNLAVWHDLRRRYRELYTNELASTYFTSVMRKVFADVEVSIEFEDDGIAHTQAAPDEIITRISLKKHFGLTTAVQLALGESIFKQAFSEKRNQEIDIIIDILGEHLAEDDPPTSLELLKEPFFRGKGAYLVGQLITDETVIPIVFCCVSSGEGITLDAILVGYKATRSFLFSSTRSAFTVSTKHYRELYSFLQRLYPHENPAYILDIIGFTHPAKVSLLRQLRKIIEHGEQFKYLGSGHIDFVFGVTGFPLVFKVIRREAPDKQSIINNFIKVHTIDRSGQILDSLDYRNLKFPKSQFSKALIRKLRQEQPEDVIIGDDHIFFRRVYAARRIEPVVEQVRTRPKTQARELLLRVGWNIKHLAAMGFVPQSMGLENFGLTSWGRVVYLDNPSLKDIRMFSFQPEPESKSDSRLLHIDPARFEQDLDIPPQHKDIFRAIHGDLFSPHFWNEIKNKVQSGQYPEFFPYPSRYRVNSRKFRSSVFQELQRVSDTAETRQIHMALDTLAVADVELAGLSFLRLEVPSPSARVLVIEPIGPEIIAQLHHRFQDVTFDILQAESEVVESAGQWTPGIHGKLNALVQVRKYDYVIGYVNETFDEDFFRLAKLKGFLLLSTGTHNIDVEAATSFHTVVTNAPGPTTTTVAEQNIGLILDAVYSHKVKYAKGADGFVAALHNPALLAEPLALAQALWLSLLQKTLRIDRMFSFGASELYVRTGVGDQATVYHDQIGQNQEAGIIRSLGVVGLNEIGVLILEFAIGHEVSTLYVLREEYDKLSSLTKERLRELIAVKQEISPTENLSTQLIAVEPKELERAPDYIFHTGTADQSSFVKIPGNHSITIDIGNLFEHDLLHFYQSSSSNLTLGIQGLGRIGEAVAQRAIILGMNVIIYQRNPERPKYQDKLSHLKKLADYRTKYSGSPLKAAYASNKDEFFEASNIITTLAATTDSTRDWVDQEGLDRFGSLTRSPIRVIVSAGKGLVDEGALINFLSENPNAEARLDVLVGEHEGKAILKLFDTIGARLTNIKVTGHTAAAVREVRQLKIYKALDNLRELIDGRIPPNIVNDPITGGETGGEHSIVEIEGLKFFRMSVPSSRVKVLVIEPLPPEIVLHLQQEFGDVSFDILLAESELVEVDGHWLPGINSKLNEIVAQGNYDYCLGYCNANFDAAFFSTARLQGLILFATATHHIDLETATRMGTIVANSPGFTTVAVTEQNIAMALEALYGPYVQEHGSDEATALSAINFSQPHQARTAAHLMWYVLMKRALRLDAMYEFGTGGKYVRTGVRQDATVYHDQLGQHGPAGINNIIGIIGLDEVGLSLAELAMGFEVSAVLVLEQEYKNLTEEDKTRLHQLQTLIPEISSTKDISIEIKLVDPDELIQESTYTFKTPRAYTCRDLRDIKPISSIHILADRLYVNVPEVWARSMIGLTFGVQGLGRIGEAVVQRALALGADITVCQRSPERTKYQEKQRRLKRYAHHLAKVFSGTMDVRYVGKQELFGASHIVTTLAATTSQTRFWVDWEALNTLARETSGPVKILVNAGKGLLNEADLELFLKKRPDVQVRLDVLTDEQVGQADQRFLDEDGKPYPNIKIAGHTASAVPELRRLKMLNALNNLRLHLNGQTPNNILNPEVFSHSS